MMTEMKRGFLGLTPEEWGRALATGGLSVVSERDTELSHEDQVAKAKELGSVMLTAKSEIENMPREILIEAAWQGVARYYVETTIWKNTEAVEEEKDLRLSWLTDEERERAILLARDWLGSNFGK